MINDRNEVFKLLRKLKGDDQGIVEAKYVKKNISSIAFSDPIKSVG